jgi:hypothetical protein
MFNWLLMCLGKRSADEEEDSLEQLVPYPSSHLGRCSAQWQFDETRFHVRYLRSTQSQSSFWIHACRLTKSCCCEWELLYRLLRIFLRSRWPFLIGSLESILLFLIGSLRSRYLFVVSCFRWYNLFCLAPCYLLRSCLVAWYFLVSDCLFRI